MKRAALVGILTVAVAAAYSLPAATAASPAQDATAILSRVAGRPVTARCVPTGHGMNFADLDRRGGPGNGARIASRYCAAVARMIRERHDWQAGYAEQLALVSIIHEGEHLRGGPGWRNETTVQCRALHALPRIATWLGVQLDDPVGSARWIWRYSPPEYRAGTCPGISG